MAAVVAVMSTSTAPPAPKRHGFSIESLIGKSESSSPPLPAIPAPSRPLPIRPLANRDSVKEERHRVRGDRDVHREREARESKEKECREKESDMWRERELVMEMRERQYMHMRERELLSQRDMPELRDNGDGRGSNPHLQRQSPGSRSPASPRGDKSLTPEAENKVGAWPGEEFKHLLDSFHSGQLDANSLYQPLRVCNRTLASLGGMPGGPPNGLGMPSHFAHMPINPLLYNLPRDMSHQHHPLLAARYPGFMHPRYPIGPPPGLLFHPYRKPKRNRTAFSPSQLLQLEQAFERNHYVVGQERKTLASKLQLTETQVKVWFQNRRTKHKRMKAEEDGGSSGSHAEGQDGEDGKGGDGSEFTSYMDHNEEDEQGSEDEEEEELSVTEDF